MEETEVKSKPWQWPNEWVRDETFWRDVASRAVAGLIVVFIGYLIAVASGLLGLPDLRKVLAVLLVAAGMSLLMWPLVLLSKKIIGIIRKRIHPRWLSIMFTVSWALIYFALVLVWMVLFLNAAKWAYEGA